MLKQRLNADFEYRIAYTTNLFAPENQTLSHIFEKGCRAKIQVFLDAGVHRAFPDLTDDINRWAESAGGNVRLASPIEVVPGGEAIKNGMHHVEEMAAKMANAGLCRHSYAMIIGGGAVLDAAGFAASVFHRGIRQIRIPTTLLSQDDSAVGVKNSINVNGTKNLFGCFHPPDAVIIDFAFLATLDQREILSGIAEAFKVAIIKDVDFFKYLQSNITALKAAEPSVMAQLVRTSSKLHLDHIRDSGDPFEKGSSRPLDFGHWAAHKLEALTRNELRHGEAVAIGMALDILCAVQINLISMALAREILETFEQCGLPIWHPALDHRNRHGDLSILKGLDEFREHLGGALTLAMPTDIGRCIDIHELPEAAIEKAVGLLRDKAAP